MPVSSGNPINVSPFYCPSCAHDNPIVLSSDDDEIQGDENTVGKESPDTVIPVQSFVDFVAEHGQHRTSDPRKRSTGLGNVTYTGAEKIFQICLTWMITNGYEQLNFVDLGSGSGELVAFMSVIASISTVAIEIVAIEIVKASHMAALELFRSLSHMFPKFSCFENGQAIFVNRCMLSEEVIRFRRKANIIFVNNLLFEGVNHMGVSLNSQLAQLLAYEIGDSTLVLTTLPLGTKHPDRDGRRTLICFDFSWLPPNGTSWTFAPVRVYFHKVATKSAPLTDARR